MGLLCHGIAGQVACVYIYMFVLRQLVGGAMGKNDEFRMRRHRRWVTINVF